MKIVRAQFLGMCFGVRDAIALAKTKAAEGPVTILGELVHNESVLDDLRRSGVAIENRLEKVATTTAIVTAHGTSRKALAAARAHGLELFEGTCPLVHHAHRAVERFVKEGFYPVIIGKADHVEVRGITDDLSEFTVVQSEADLERIPAKGRIGVAAQTTQPIERVRKLVEVIRARFSGSEVRFADTVCLPTKQRQTAAEELSKEVELVVVIGGANSNNTRELAATCGRYCARVHHVQTADEVRAEWLQGVESVGITAGTSTPDWIIEAVEERIRELGEAIPRATALAVSE